MNGYGATTRMAPNMTDGCLPQWNPNVPAEWKVTFREVPELVVGIGFEESLGWSGVNGCEENEPPLHVTVVPAAIITQFGENCAGDDPLGSVIVAEDIPVKS